MTFGDERTANLGSVIGVLAAIAALLAALALVPRLLPDGQDQDDQGIRNVYGNMPGPGECYNGRLLEENVLPQRAPCDEPHYGEVVKEFELPDMPWPGQAELFDRVETECEKHLRQRFGTRTPVEEGRLGVYAPREEGWLAGDRTAYCAINAQDGQMLDRPLPAKDTGVREWWELKTADCFTVRDHQEMTYTVRLADCSEPHTGQVTAVPELENGLYPGDEVLEKMAKNACRAAGPAAIHDPSRGVLLWWRIPFKESWNAGERTVICYITADGGELKRSLVDAKD